MHLAATAAAAERGAAECGITDAREVAEDEEGVGERGGGVGRLQQQPEQRGLQTAQLREPW